MKARSAALASDIFPLYVCLREGGVLFYVNAPCGYHVRGDIFIFSFELYYTHMSDAVEYRKAPLGPFFFSFLFQHLLQVFFLTGCQLHILSPDYNPKYLN